jgi:long-chain acyl-CoA synthetase
MDFPEYRLFDAVEYQLKNFPKADMLGAKVDGIWKTFSTEEISSIVNRMSAGLLDLGISGRDFTAESSDKIAMISNNRPEWIFADLAVQQLGAVLVPLYPTTNPHELAFILNESQAKYIFVSSRELLEKIKEIKSEYLQGIFTFDKIEGVAHYTELAAKATAETLLQVEQIRKTIPNSHTATIIYTSGTTGIPKGVMLSHANIISNVFFSKESFPFPDQPQARVLSFLPLNHIFEKMVTYIYLFSGISVYYAESLETIADNLRELQPNGFSTVPRLLEKVYERIISKGRELKGIKKAIFFGSVAVARKYDNRKKGSFIYEFLLKVARKLVFSKWKEALGGRIEFIVTGGAAASEKLLRIFNAAEIPIYEGYGPTEHSPVIAVNRKASDGMYFGTVGPPINGVEVKLAPDGEILARSPSIMQGYYKRPDLTADAVKDGWLYTGDIGIWVEDRFLKITDRKKELFKTSGGKYVAPQPIENKMKESRHIEQIIVVGDGQKFVGALVVPSFVAVSEWLMERYPNEQFTHEQIAAHPEVNKLIGSIIEHYNKNFNHVEQIKKFVLLPHEWTVAGGEMTPKLSLRRKVVLDKYRDEIEKLYS